MLVAEPGWPPPVLREPAAAGVRPAAVLHRLLALPTYRTSALFNDPDRLVLDHAVGMNCTPAEVPDELFAPGPSSPRTAPFPTAASWRTERPGAGRRHGTGVGTNLTMASATATGPSTGTHVLAPETETSVAQGNSDASRRASVIGK